MKFTNRQEANDFYREITTKAIENDCLYPTLNNLGRRDLFFLLTKLLKRKDVDQDWLFERCKEVQLSPDGHLDLWAREHYKSTIITYAKSIQDILDSHHWKNIGDKNEPKWVQDSLLGWDQEVTIGIFSHSRDIAMGFLGQIKKELEDNELLKQVYPQVLYSDPRRQSPRWTDKRITVKRRTNPKEQTVEAWGVVDRQPTSKHFVILNYDDVVTEESVNTPDQIAKTTQRWAVSLNLGAHGGVRRTIGTRYHHNDTYAEMIKRESVDQRIYAATDNGKVDGQGVFLSNEELAKKRKDFGPYVYGCQMLQDPTADKAQGFHVDWLRYYDKSRLLPERLNVYLLCDPAGEKKEISDYTVMTVIGLGEDEKYYLLDGIRDRLNLTERTKALFRLHRKWKPKKTGYEKYGKDSDIEHIEDKMEDENYHFDITPLGGIKAKNDRIRKLVPIFEQHRFLIPHQLIYADYEGEPKDFIQQFIDDEYTSFPVGHHDDMLDDIARIRDPEFEAEFPMVRGELDLIRDKYKQPGQSNDWHPLDDM